MNNSQEEGRTTSRFSFAQDQVSLQTQFIVKNVPIFRFHTTFTLIVFPCYSLEYFGYTQYLNE